jgi:hypothetical protein
MSDENRRPSALEILGKVIVITVALAVGASILGGLVIGACALMMR